MAANGDADAVVLDHNCIGLNGLKILTEDKTFLERQKSRLKEIERKLEEETKKKKKDWEKEVDRMREEFLKLFPADKVWGSDELINDPMILRRKGSTEVLDKRKMRTLISDSPYSGCKYKLRFDVKDFDTTSIDVKVEKDKSRIVVSATKAEETESGEIIDRIYCRKIEKPPEVDAEKIRCVLTKDDVLIVEAALPPHTLNFKSRKHSGSPSHSMNSSHSMHSYTSSNRSRSPSGSPSTTPLGALRPNMPTFTGEPNARRMALLVEVGTEFKPPDVSVQVINSTRILVKIKNETRTPDKVSKKKFCKEFELPERIEPFSMRAGFSDGGLLYVVALGRDHDKRTKELAVREMCEDLVGKGTPCNVLDLAKFPPASNPQTPVKKPDSDSTTSIT